MDDKAAHVDDNPPDFRGHNGEYPELEDPTEEEAEADGGFRNLPKKKEADEDEDDKSEVIEEIVRGDAEEEEAHGGFRNPKPRIRLLKKMLLPLVITVIFLLATVTVMDYNYTKDSSAGFVGKLINFLRENPECFNLEQSETNHTIEDNPLPRVADTCTRGQASSSTSPAVAKKSPSYNPPFEEGAGVVQTKYFIFQTTAIIFVFCILILQSLWRRAARNNYRQRRR